MILKNKGMFLETIINQSIPSLLEHGLLLQKMPLDNTVLNIDDNIITGKLKVNKFCDYCGVYQGQYIEFEAKETELDYFTLNNIKPKQLQKLILVEKLGGCAFVVIYFHKNQKFYVLPLSTILESRVKKIPLHWFTSNGIEIKFQNLVLHLEMTINHLINYKL